MENSKVAKGIHWFSSLAVGSFITSGGFYLVYDQWKPMVWSAAAIGFVFVCRHFSMTTDY